MDEYQKEQVRLRDRELTLKADELALERRKHLATFITIAVSVLGALLTYLVTRQGQLEQSAAQLRLQQQAAQDAFELKAAEIAMSGRGSFDAKGKLEALAGLFHGRLPSFASFDARKHAWGRSSKSELLELLAGAPTAEHRRALVRAYKALLGEDDSIKKLPDDL